MKHGLICFLILSFSCPSFANLCLNYQKNCEGISAKRRFLDWTPVCEMVAYCDFYCGNMKVRRGKTKLYCKFKEINGDTYTCLAPDDCLYDKSVITSEADIERLSNKPTSPGSGLRVPKEIEQGGTR